MALVTENARLILEPHLARVAPELARAEVSACLFVFVLRVEVNLLDGVILERLDSVGGGVVASVGHLVQTGW